MTTGKADEAKVARIREILASWPATTDAQRTRAVAILSTAKTSKAAAAA